MDQRSRYLSNPYFKMDKKIKQQLGVTTNEVTDDGVALEIDEPIIATKKQVVKKRANYKADEDTLQEQTLE